MLDTQIPADSSLERCADLWFDDCGLIVRADHTLFRVSAAMLGAQSAVFADMREFKQPDDAEKIDGCPVLRLPDPAREVRVFFKALFDPSFFRDYPAETDYSTLEGVLHLSHKYEVPVLKKRALTHLSTQFLAEMVPSWDLEINQYPSIINLCSEVDAPWILVPACYACCHYCTVHDVILGTTVDDRHVVLRPDLQISILSATNKLRTEGMSEFLEFICRPGYFERCRTPAECIPTARQNVARYHTEEFERRLLPGNIHEDLDPSLSGWSVCIACQLTLKNGLGLARRKFIADVPGLFGYSDWDILEKHKTDFFEDLGV